MINADLIKIICPSSNGDIVSGVVKEFLKNSATYGLDTPIRECHFFAQASEETAYFRTLTEYASGQEYEYRSDLGNVEAGDGPRYKGRGIFQVTGRFNYKIIGDAIGHDILNEPVSAAFPEIAVKSALYFWRIHDLNRYADADDCRAITERINGGLNGYDARYSLLLHYKSLYEKPQGILPLAHVTSFQSALQKKGYNITVDGLFGSQSEAVVKTFQHDHGLSPSGVVDKNTLTLINT
jgi:putative chitinase